ncbi:MAG: hypothetical protein P4N59_12305 [Negativicutes bacterium]|nr:hypothetical protein [Negativicutes bacterium]
MEKELTTNLTSSMKRTLLIFIVGGFILNFAVNIVFDVLRVVWIDFFHYNPYRSQYDALYLMRWFPIVALLRTLYLDMLPVVLNAIIAVVSQRIWGCVPFYSLFIMLLLSAPVVFLYPEIVNGPNPVTYMDFLGFSLMQMPVVVGCWWWSSRTPKN